MSWRIIRSSALYQIGAASQVQVLRAPGGPRGLPASQDVGWAVSSNLRAGETLTLPPLPHPAVFAVLYAHSDSGVAAAQSVLVQQKRSNAVVATASLALGVGANDWSAALAAPLTCLVGDVLQLVLPTPADLQLSDLAVSLGSEP